MNKKQRMGSDPFSWIKDSRSEEPEESAAQNKSAAAATHEPAPPEESRTTRQGLRAGWKRHTFIVREQHLKKIQAVAYWERRDIKEVVDEAFQQYLKEKDVRDLPR